LKNKHCVVLAGGEGTRIAEITRGEIPKALIPVNGTPFLDYKIDSLIKIGFTGLTLLLGRHSDQIVDHMKRYINSDAEVNCIKETNPLGTGGAVLAALGALPNTFWVTYADSLVFPDGHALKSIDIATSTDKSIMCVIRGNDEWGRSNVELDSGRISFYSRDQKDSSEHDLSWIEYGLLRLSKNAFRDFANKTQFDLGEVIQSQVLGKSMLPLVCKERFREVGNVRSFYETEQWISSKLGGHR
jgi:NDP-sugar pyrophosphorylase family protein